MNVKMAQIHHQNRASSYGREEKHNQKQKHKQKQKHYSECMSRKVDLFDLNNGAATSKMLPTEMPHGEGNGHIRKRVDVRRTAMDSSRSIDSPTEENSFPCGLRNSSKPASGMPMKMLIADEMSKETDNRRHSPSIIAKLMGLDTLPTQPAQNQQKRKASKNYVQRASGNLNSYPLTKEAYPERDALFLEKHVTYESHSFRKNIKEQQQFKDVFEIWETSKVEKMDIEKSSNLPSQSGTTSLKLGETKMALIRQKFMDAKRLATDENLHHSKEFDDALEVLDSNKDLFLRILQEPDSLFTKHLHNLPTPPRSSHITVLKSSKYSNCEMYEKSERKIERDAKLQGHMNFEHKHEESHVRRSKNAVHPSHKSSQSQIKGKSEVCPLPTRIVVLKPSLAKAQTAARSVSSSSPLSCLQTDHRKHREFRKSGDQELFSEPRDWQRMPKSDLDSNGELVRCRPKGSREIAGEITRRMRQNMSVGSMKLSRAARNGYAGEDELSYNITDKLGNNFEILTPTSEKFHDWNNRFSPSSSYSSESSVSREAKKHLLERWKLMHGVQDSGRIGRSSSTLGEMLTLPEIEGSGREMGRAFTLNYMIGEDDSSERFAGNGEVTRWGCPPGISSNEGWKEGCPRNLQRSRSVPASSTVNGSPKTCSRRDNERGLILRDLTKRRPERPVKGRSFNTKDSSQGNRKSNGKKYQSVLYDQPVNNSNMENNLHITEIHMSSDDLRNKVEEMDLSVQKAVISEPSPDGNDISQLGNCIEVGEYGDSRRPSENHGELLLKPTEYISTSLEDGVDAASDQNVIIAEVSSSEQPLSRSPQAHLKPGLHETEPESPGSIKGSANQPSPVSVLEPPFEEEVSSSEGFEQVSADLHGLRMQLHLLKLESEDGYMVVSSDEEHGEEALDVNLTEEQGKSPRMFCGEENIDFSFVLNMLICSGFHDINDREVLSAVWYSPEAPVDPCIFEKLEKQYGLLESVRSISERRLLFDCINSSLVEVLGPCLDLHPWVNPRVTSAVPMPTREILVEKVWSLLVQEGEERFGESLEAVMKRDLVKERGWLELGEYVDMIGREMERDLMDDLVEEIVCGF